MNVLTKNHIRQENSPGERAYGVQVVLIFFVVTHNSDLSKKSALGISENGRFNLK